MIPDRVYQLAHPTYTLTIRANLFAGATVAN